MLLYFFNDNRSLEYYIIFVILLHHWNITTSVQYARVSYQVLELVVESLRWSMSLGVGHKVWELVFETRLEAQPIPRLEVQLPDSATYSKTQQPTLRLNNCWSI